MICPAGEGDESNPKVMSESCGVEISFENKKDNEIPSQPNHVVTPPPMSRLVSHIPPPARVSVTETTASAESSLSSGPVHAFGPLSRKSDEETFEGTAPLPSKLAGDSSNESWNESPPTEPAKHSERQKTPIATYCSLTCHKRSRKNLSGEKEINETDGGPAKKPRVVETGKPLNELAAIAPAPSKTVLLAQPNDEDVLSPLHVFIRKQIEVFRATEIEIAQPAPGRKIPIQLDQVGLRCIHCRHLPPRERVKRGVCYPSCVGRVYNSVSDMKFDHFNNCACLPEDVRARLNELKEQDKSSKKSGNKNKSSKPTGKFSSTAHYYHDSARQMGMTDGRLGVFMVGDLGEENKKKMDDDKKSSDIAPKPKVVTSPQRKMVPRSVAEPGALVNNQQNLSLLPQKLLSLNAKEQLVLGQQLYQQTLAQPTMVPFLFAMMAGNVNNLVKTGLLPPDTSTKNRSSILLASPVDHENLNDLHCFVRRHVEVFAADEKDLSSPSPGRKQRIYLGQVGIRCVHCVHLPLKDRVKRAVCYPPSVSGIYHAISNMKFDHFGNCKGLPPQARGELAALRASIGRKNATGRSSSTAQYYRDSAVRLGLVDTDKGIRFKQHVVTPQQLLESGKKETQTQHQEGKEEVETDGFSALVLAATDPQIRAMYGRSV